MLSRIAIGFLILTVICVVGVAQESKPVESKPVADSRPVMLEGASKESFLARVEKAMSAVQSVAATFQQDKKLSIFKDVVQSKGVLTFASPNSLRWEITEPFRSILIVAGSNVAKFEFVDGKRRVLQLGRGADLLQIAMERIRQLFVGKFDRTEYVVEAAEKPIPIVRLTPKGSAPSQLLSIELQLASALDAVNTVIIRERSGDSTVMRFTQVARNVQFKAGTFSVTDPIELDPSRLVNLPPVTKSK